ncbi:MAG TPA: M48 family metallopeptidase [Candidatus Acidoferrum sp.]|nr:M48 family metallopeptidase [Candidatus Acidoferrum sp.]
MATASLFALAVLLGSAVRAQQSCSVTPAPRIPTAAHIFSIQQERALGDVEAEWVETSYHAVHDDGLESHLNRVASRILSQFPPEQARVRVILIDAPEANSFSVAPERIYITRKMVAMLNNDDELAGLLGHELGHILMHENAIIVSQLFHEVLGVNAVGDRKDISEKLRRMLDCIDRDRKSLRKAAQIIEGQEGIRQYEADRVALYASAAAGFSPQAYVELFDRSAGTNGRSGSVLTDFFGATTSNLRRLREIKKTVRQLPPPCREIVPGASAEFLTWQAAVISYPDLARR